MEKKSLKRTRQCWENKILKIESIEEARELENFFDNLRRACLDRIERLEHPNYKNLFVF